MRDYCISLEERIFDRSAQCFRTVAIRYQNGSIHDLVQLEGSSEYKHLMRRLALGDKSIQKCVKFVDSSNETIAQFPVNNGSQVKYSGPCLWKSPTERPSGAVLLFQGSGVRHWYRP